MINEKIRRNFFFSTKELDEIRKRVYSVISLFEQGTDTRSKLCFHFFFLWWRYESNIPLDVISVLHDIVRELIVFKFCFAWDSLGAEIVDFFNALFAFLPCDERWIIVAILASEHNDFFWAYECGLVRIGIVASISTLCDFCHTIILGVEQNYISEVITIITAKDSNLGAVDSDNGWVVPILKNICRGLDQRPGFFISLSTICSFHGQTLNWIKVSWFTSATEDIDNVIKHNRGCCIPYHVERGQWFPGVVFDAMPFNISDVASNREEPFGTIVADCWVISGVDSILPISPFTFALRIICCHLASSVLWMYHYNSIFIDLLCVIPFSIPAWVRFSF